MEHTIRASDLARKLGDVLSRVRWSAIYRNDSFVVEWKGARVARLTPVSSPPATATVGEALDAWLSGADADPAFADDLATIGASDRPPDDPWRRSPPPQRGAALRSPDRLD